MTTITSLTVERYQSNGRLLRYEKAKTLTACVVTISQSLNRHFITKSTRLLVMSGALAVSCTRYGVWDMSHLKIILALR